MKIGMYTQARVQLKARIAYWLVAVHLDVGSFCSHRSYFYRTGLSGRGTKLVLVWLQNSTPLPSTEDVLAADRAAVLCQVCDLPPKSLFVMPCRSDHLQGYTLRYQFKW